MRGFFICVLLFVILLLVIVFGAPVSSDPAAHTSYDPSISSLLPVAPPLGPEIRKRDTAILVTPDGMVILVDGKSEKILGSFTSGAPTYSSYQALDASAEGENFYIDCGKDGKLYVHENGVRKGPCINVEDILRQTPYVSASGIMLSSKKTTVFLVDADTGKVIRSFKSDNFSSVENLDAEGNPIIAKKDFDQYIEYGDTESEALSKALYVMRTDYSIKFASSKTGKILWYLGFADIKASFQCKGIEEFLNGIYNENPFGPSNKIDVKLPLDCYKGLNVYLSRDYSSLESLLMSAGLLNSLPGGTVLSLPTPDQANSLLPLDKWSPLHQNNEDREALALLPPGTKNYEMKSLPGGNGSEMDVTVASDIYTGFQFWPPVLLFAVLLMAGFLFRFYRVAAGKQDKLHKQAGDLKSQALTSRKKKARKAGLKNSSNDEKKQKSALSDKEVSDTNVLPIHEITERSLQLTFSKGFEGYANGRRIGKLVISNKEIAKGSNGTVVLEGFHDGRPVAVKRLVQTHHDVALKEIQNLIASDQHPNIIRWYGVEYDQDFIYLSLERCTCNLEELISSYSGTPQNEGTSGGELHDSSSNCTLKLQYTDPDDNVFKLWKANGYPSPQLLKLMRDIVSGLAHLHELGIVHRDLKPQNVLVIKERSICAKLSDMGISKRLAGNMSALTKHATGYGSSGWQAPEQLRRERQTRAIDLFSLGCVFFFCITGGEHPFGEIWERDANIIHNRKDLFLIESIPEAKDLISRLLDPEPELRPRTREILSQPLFWSSETRLSFLRDASDRVELEDRANYSELWKALESVGAVSFGNRWDEKMQSIVINDIGRYRRYKFDSVRDLLRVIRNKLNHYRELSTEIQEILGQVPDGFDDYFSSRFPSLLINVYRVIHRFCAEEDNFSKYFFSNQF